MPDRRRGGGVGTPCTRPTARPYSPAHEPNLELTYTPTRSVDARGEPVRGGDRSRCGAGGGPPRRPRCPAPQSHSDPAPARAGRSVQARGGLFQAGASRRSGTIRADGHNVDLYGAVLIRRDRICASPEGARWTCGQRAFMATRALVEGQPLSCSFRQAEGALKAVCWVGDNDVTKSLLSQGWAELAEGVTEESYVEAEASARRIKAGIWGDGPP